MSFLEDMVIVDRTGLEAEVGVFGELKTASFFPQIPVAFDRPLSARQFAITGTPVAQYNGSLLRLTAGDQIQTRAALRYLEGQTVEIYFTASFPGVFAAGADESYIGMFDGDDGVFVGYKGDQFVVGYRNIYADGGTEPDVVQVIAEPGDLSKIHRFRIRYGYLGVGNITIEIKDPSAWRLLHVFETDGSLTGRTHIGRTAIPLRAQVEHAAGEILSGSWVAGSIGDSINVQEVPFSTGSERTVVGSVTAQPVVALRNKTVNGTRPNYIVSQLVSSEYGTGSEGLYRFEIYKFPAGSITTGAWADINAASVLEVNETFTETTAGGEEFLSTLIAVAAQGQGVARSTLDYSKADIALRPGEELAVFKRELIAGTGDDLTAWTISYVDLY